MSQYRPWVIALLPLLLLTFAGRSGSVYAQQAPTPPGDYGGPFMANPGAIPPEELKKDFQKREEYCRTHPGGCIADQHMPPPVNIYSGPYAPPVPTTVCHPDPNNPAKPICVQE